MIQRVENISSLARMDVMLAAAFVVCCWLSFFFSISLLAEFGGGLVAVIQSPFGKKDNKVGKRGQRIS